MSTTLAKVYREYASTEAGLSLANGQWGQAQDTGRIKAVRRDGTADWFNTAAQFSSTSASYGTALIGSIGITGITPNGGSSGSTATLQNMLTGMAASVVLKAPYASTTNLISIAADTYGLRIRNYGSQTQNPFQLEKADTTALAYFDYTGNLTIQNSINTAMYLSVSNGYNSNASAHAQLDLSVGGASGGDPKVRFLITSGASWAIGADNSDSDRFKISASASLGTTDVLTMSTSGVVNVAASDFSVNNTKFYVEFASGRTAIGGTGSTDGWLYLTGTTGLVAGVNNYGMVAVPVFQSNATLSGTVIDLQLKTQAAAFTMTTGYGIHIETPSLGATSAVTTNYAVKVEDQTGPGTNYAWYSGAGLFRVGGDATFAGDLTVTRSNVGGGVYATISNTDNTNAASDARLFLWTGGGSAGDPFIRMDVSGVTNWALGADNSDSDTFKISKSGALGTNDYLTISTSGVVSLLAVSSSRLMHRIYNSDTGGSAHTGLKIETGYRVADTYQEFKNTGQSFSFGLTGTGHSLGGYLFAVTAGADFGGTACMTIDSNGLVRAKASMIVEGNYLKVPSIAGTPSSPSNGMIWYDNTGNHLCAYSNGARVEIA